MERTVLRILGKKGRTTIPWPIRVESAEKLEITFKDGNRRVVVLSGRG